MEVWTTRIMEEFWQEGDEEKRLGVTVGLLNDRTVGVLNVPKAQVFRAQCSPH